MVEALEGRSLPSAALAVPPYNTPANPGAIVAPPSVQTAVVSHRHHRHHRPAENHLPRHHAHPARASIAPAGGNHLVQQAIHLAQDWLFPF
jgi:hypothetical protein